MRGYQKGTGIGHGRIEVLDAGLLIALANEGLLALSLQFGLEVFRQMLGTDVMALARAEGTHNPDRSAHGWSWAARR